MKNISNFSHNKIITKIPCGQTYKHWEDWTVWYNKFKPEP